jgi:hypothetical protein
MFPDSDDAPARFCEPGLGVDIPSHVSFDLFVPEIGIAHGGTIVFWAAVPETSVYEDSHFRTRKDDVCGTAELRDGPDTDPVAQA